jgi:hypothetical protein
MNVITAADTADKEKHISTFTINDDNNITVYASAEEASQGETAGLIQFESQAALAKVASDWAMSRFVEIWNGIPGQTPIKKFQDRKKAVSRIWSAIQSLAGNGPSSESATEKPERPLKVANTFKKARSAMKVSSKGSGDKASERSNKKAEVIVMMSRTKGATLAEIMQVTGWQKHTVRGFVSLLSSKGGQMIESSKNPAGERSYRITE